MISRLTLQRELLRRQAKRDPASYREVIRLGAAPAPLLQEIIQPWQTRDFQALDAAWLALSGNPPPAKKRRKKIIRRAYLERPRGHSKTTDTAVQVTWILQWSPHCVRGLAAAADQDQAQLIHTAIADLVRHNPTICPDLRVQKQLIKNVDTGSELQVISSDVNSSWGQLPDFVLCDELCHWSQPDLWYSLCSSAAKKPDCVLLVLTNAGIGTGWQWDVREAARTSRDWHFSTLDGPQAPWITPESLAEQQRLLPPAVYARLWENRWQHSDGEFVTLAEAEACIDDALSYKTLGQPQFEYIAAVDYAEKHDRTVGVVLHREGTQLIVDRLDIAVPQPGQPVLVRWVEDWIQEIAAGFPHVRFILDEYQLLAVIQKYGGIHDIQKFDFGAGRGNHALALALRQLIVHRQVRWYRGCGAWEQSVTQDDLVTELAALRLRNSTGGRVRIDHRRGGGCHDDRAFALGAACLGALREQHGPDWCDVTPPGMDGGFAW